MKEGKNGELKTLAKAAKKRMKSGFWQNYGQEVSHFAEKAKASGVKTSEIVKYYETKNSQKLNGSTCDEFYLRVKKLLDEEGEVSDAIGRLTDYSVFDELDYSGKQKYILDLSDKYRQAVERYYREKEMQNGVK